MNRLTIKDMLFFQENAYQVINEIGKKAEDKTLMDFVIAEKHKYKEKIVRKNFLRNHHAAISLIVPTLAGATFILLIAEPVFLFAAFAIIWILVFEAMYNFGVRELYFKV